MNEYSVFYLIWIDYVLFSCNKLHFGGDIDSSRWIGEDAKLEDIAIFALLEWLENISQMF